MVERLSPVECRQRIEQQGCVYLDVRTVEEYEQGHPEGAYNIPLMLAGEQGMQPNPEFLPLVQRTFLPETGLVLG